MAVYSHCQATTRPFSPDQLNPDGFVDCAGKPERISRNRIELRRLLQEPIILRRITATFRKYIVDAIHHDGL